MILEKFPRVLKWLLWLTALTPLISWQDFYFPFLTAKAFYFRTLVELSVIVFLLLLAYGYREFKWHRIKHWVSWSVLGILVVSFISSYLGDNFFDSFWSSFRRMDGLVNLLHLIPYFFLLVISFEKEDWERFLKVLAISGGIAALYGIGQKLGFEFLAETGLDRISGTLGNAAFLASFLIFSGFLSLFFANRESGRNKKIFWYLLVTLSLIGIYLTGTRGAILSLLLTFGLFLLYDSLFGSQEKRKKISRIILIILVLFGGLFLLNRDSFKDSEIAVVQRFANIGLDDTTTRSRLYIWENSLQYISEKPILGYGLENFDNIYDEIYDPRYLQEDWFDRSHNIYIDYAISTGLVGLLLYLSLFVFLLKETYKKSREDNTFLIFFFMVIAYGVQNIFVFDSTTTSLTFYALVAFMLFMAKSVSSVDEYDGKNVASESLKYLYIVLAILVFVPIYFVNIIPAKDNLTLGRAYYYQVANIDKYLENLNKVAKSKSMAYKETAYQTYNMFLNQTSYRAPSSGERISDQNLERIYKNIVPIVEDSMERDPTDVRLKQLYGNIYELGLKYEDRGDQTFLDQLSKGVELAPKRHELVFMLANIYLRRSQNADTQEELIKNQEEAIEILVEYDEVLEDYVKSKFALAYVLEDLGYSDLAKKYYAEGVPLYEKSIEDAKNAVNYLVRAGRFDELVPYLEYLVFDGEPDSLGVKFDLAQAYFAAGRVADSYNMIMEISNQNPEVLNISPEFVQQVVNAYNSGLR